MKNMDEASKLFTGLPEVFCDLVDFALKGTGFRVVRGSMKERNAESIAQLRGVQTWFKKVSNDVVAELKVTDGDVTTTLLVALENQTSTSTVMAGRSLMSTAIRWDSWRREMKNDHIKRKELKTHQELLDGVLPGDQMAPVMIIVVHFGQEQWTGLPRFTDMLDCPPSLKPKLADCPVNVISFYNLPIEQINEMPPGAMRAVAKSIHFANDINTLSQEIKNDPSFRKLLDEGPDEALNIIRIATGLNTDLLKQQKEDDMPQKVSKYEQFFVDKGEKIGEKRGEKIGEKKGEKKGRKEGRKEGLEEGIATTIMNFIQNRRKRSFSDMQIQNDLQLDFGLDETKACQYMAAATKA